MIESSQYSLTILHVDDDPGDREAVSNLLASIKGIKLIACEAPGLMQQFASDNMQVSIVDLKYHGKIRDQEVVGNVRDIAPDSGIIVLSNFATGDSNTNAYGANDIISKDSFRHKPELLLRAILNFLTGGPPSSASSPAQELILEVERAIEKLRSESNIDLQKLLMASLRWALSDSKTFTFLAALVIAFVILLCSLALIPVGLLLVSVALSCLAIGFQCSHHIVESARATLTAGSKRKPHLQSKTSSRSWDI